jgi:hypothetical protein
MGALLRPTPSPGSTHQKDIRLRAIPGTQKGLLAMTGPVRLLTDARQPRCRGCWKSASVMTSELESLLRYS